MIVWSKSSSSLVPPKIVETKKIASIVGPARMPVVIVAGQTNHRSRKKAQRGKFAAFFNLYGFVKKCATLDRDTILSLLRDLAEKKYPNPLPYKVRRNRVPKVLPEDKCLACKSVAEVCHHVIMVKHGGPNNRRNIIPLCHKCHAEIHHWIVPNIPEAKQMDREFREIIGD